jgi:hypothetical protein
MLIYVRVLTEEVDWLLLSLLRTHSHTHTTHRQAGQESEHGQ